MTKCPKGVIDPKKGILVRDQKLLVFHFNQLPRMDKIERKPMALDVWSYKKQMRITFWYKSGSSPSSTEYYEIMEYKATTDIANDWTVRILRSP